MVTSPYASFWKIMSLDALALSLHVVVEIIEIPKPIINSLGFELREQINPKNEGFSPFVGLVRGNLERLN